MKGLQNKPWPKNSTAPGPRSSVLKSLDPLLLQTLWKDPKAVKITPVFSKTKYVHQTYIVYSISRYVCISKSVWYRHYLEGSIGSGSTFNSVYKVKVKLGHMRSSSPCLHLLSFRLHRVVQPNKSTARGRRILRAFHTMTAPHSSKFVKEEVLFYIVSTGACLARKKNWS